MKKTLNGKYNYRSFRHDPIVVKDGQVEGTPNLAAPWSLPGVLTVGTHASGEVKGELIFVRGEMKIPLTIEGTITQATEKEPACVELTGTCKAIPGKTNVNKIKGIFLEGTDHIFGTVMVLSDDLAGAPNGTAGPFILFPIKEQPEPASS